MRTNGWLRGWTSATTATVLMLALAGCGTTMPGPKASSADSSSTVGGSTTSNGVPQEAQPTAPNSDTGADVPTNIPQPIPNPEPPADPKQMNIKAIANTINSNALQVFNSSLPTKVSVYVTLVWSKADGAVAQYRVSRQDDPADKYYVRANVPPTYKGYQDGGVMNLAIDHEYNYLVEALDSSGRVIAKGTDKAKALYPIDVPKPTSPDNNADNVGISPEFSWTQMKGVDGYYVEVFSGVYFLPMWRGYRKDELGTKVTYGNASDVMPGTAPAVFTTVLNPAANYTWSVTAIKTDTGNAMTAKAWAKSNSSSWRFYCGKKPASLVGGQ